jgi:hypothetical protein
LSVAQAIEADRQLVKDQRRKRMRSRRH